MNIFSVWLDMDGVIADFDGKVTELLGHPTKEKEEVKKCMRTPNFFRSLGILPGANAAILELQSLLPGKVHILSAVPQSDPSLADEARKQKLGWLGDHYPALVATANIVTDKGAIGSSEDFIIDDHPDWNGCENFPGTIIHYTSPASWGILIKAVKEKLGLEESEPVSKVGMIKVSKIFQRARS